MRIERSGMRALLRLAGVDDHAQPDRQLDAALDRRPRREQRLVGLERRAADVLRPGALLRPPSEQAERVERVQALDLEAGRLRDRAQPLARVAAVVAERAGDRAVQARMRPPQRPQPAPPPPRPRPGPPPPAV